jgi:hypothetical protein
MCSMKAGVIWQDAPVFQETHPVNIMVAGLENGGSEPVNAVLTAPLYIGLGRCAS